MDETDNCLKCGVIAWSEACSRQRALCEHEMNPKTDFSEIGITKAIGNIPRID
jgi:hypothetical protein